MKYEKLRRRAQAGQALKSFVDRGLFGCLLMVSPFTFGHFRLWTCWKMTTLPPTNMAPVGRYLEDSCPFDRYHPSST